MKMTPENVKKINKLGSKAMHGYHKGKVSDNPERCGESKFRGFIETILEVAEESNHIVLYAGMSEDGEGDEAYLKRCDGSILGIQGFCALERYKKNPNEYTTDNVDSYIWAPNFGGWKSNNGFLT